MIILLSPSKTINPKSVDDSVVTTQPIFSDQAEQLVGSVNKLGNKLAKILGVSDKLTEENRARFAIWKSNPTLEEGTPAAWAYRGETFFGLSIEKMNEESRNFAQDHLFIVSGLYGLLGPQDLIMPYRLEMSTRLKGNWGENLYEFWADKLSKTISDCNPNFVLNCASNEYSKVVLENLPADIMVITVKFLSGSPTGLKSKMVFSKYSRGLIARWAIENRIKKPQDIKKFDLEGYNYSSEHSSDGEYAFIAPPGFSIKGRFTKT